MAAASAKSTDKHHQGPGADAGHPSPMWPRCHWGGQLPRRERIRCLSAPGRAVGQRTDRPTELGERHHQPRGAGRGPRWVRTTNVRVDSYGRCPDAASGGRRAPRQPPSVTSHPSQNWKRLGLAIIASNSAREQAGQPEETPYPASPRSDDQPHGPGCPTGERSSVEAMNETLSGSTRIPQKHQGSRWGTAGPVGRRLRDVDCRSQNVSVFSYERDHVGEPEDEHDDGRR